MKPSLYERRIVKRIHKLDYRLETMRFHEIEQFGNVMTLMVGQLFAVPS